MLPMLFKASVSGIYLYRSVFLVWRSYVISETLADLIVNVSTAIRHVKAMSF